MIREELRSSVGTTDNGLMKRDYLGDSYDAVKRLWQQIFEDWAPLYAEPRFIPQELQDDFTRLTRIPMLSRATLGPHSILNDPDTGLRLPGEDNQRESRKHIALSTILGQHQSDVVRCIVTFDQSDYRINELDREGQRQAKMHALGNGGLFSFYYVSHAPFLFTFRSPALRHQLKERLIAFGIPESRFEVHE
jgi:hypothetical protein